MTLPVFRRLPGTYRRVLRSGIAAALTFATASAAVAQTPPAPATSSVAGVVRDSLRGGVLSDAIIQLVQGGVVKREAIGKENGTYTIENMPAGTYMLRMLHPSLDTLGMAVTSPEFAIAAGQRGNIDLSIPPARRLLPALCKPEQLMRGPSAIVGMVLDPTTREPVRGITVQLDATTMDAFGMMRIPSLRTAVTDSLGRYRICGLPDEVAGKIQAERNGIKSGEVEVKISGNQLALRGISYALTNRSVAVKDTASGRMVVMLSGNGKLTGKVVNDRGQPVELARVRVLNTFANANTNSAGLFTLDSLPAGSQTVEIRKVGYGITERPVEVVIGPSSPVTLTMDKEPTILPAMTTTADFHDKALERIGFDQRRKTNIGGSFVPDAIGMRAVTRFTDGLNSFAGLSIRRCPGDTQDNCVEPITGGMRVCINYLIDGTPFKVMAQGDLDAAISAHMVQAMEYYKPAEVPAEFLGRAGDSQCSLLVVWTTAKVPAKNPRGG
jgi:hypothetical protein